MNKKKPKLIWNKIENINAGLSFYNITLTTLDDMVKELKNGTKFEEEYREYILLKLITLIENTLKKFVVFIIDERNIEISKLFTRNLEIPIEDLEKMKVPSKGELVAMNFNFQNIKEIGFVFNRLLKINFLDSLKEFFSKPDKTGAEYLLSLPKFRNQNSLFSYWNEFERMFELRRKIAHSIRYDIEVAEVNGITEVIPIEIPSNKWLPEGNEYYRKMIECTEVFLFICTAVPILIIDIQKRDPDVSKKSKAVIFFEQKMKEYVLRD